MSRSYKKFIASKRFSEIASGFDCGEMNPRLKDFQSAINKWALKRGRAAIFADTGLGKTIMQTEWAHRVNEYTGQSVLIFAPLAVAQQTIAEAARFDVSEIRYVRDQSQVTDPGIYITNYEMQEHFNPDEFIGVVLDESSILKNQTGKTRQSMIERWGSVPYRLSCTATPSPNDFTELGNQAEFLGIMSMTEMLAMFFTLDSSPGKGKGTNTWRLKGHGKRKFWEWLATWAVVIRKPSDLGFSDEGYNLPKLNIIEHEIKSAKPIDGELFARPAQTLNERRAAKRDTIHDRCSLAADLVNQSDESWIVWCHLNDEQDALEKMITSNKCSVRGADNIDAKEERLIGFTNGTYRDIISKPSICGYGMNWQHSHNMIFVGLDDSFEKFYQAVRRQWRFGQQHEVNVHIISSDAEGAIKKNIERKQKQHDEISAEMVSHMREIMKKEIFGASIEKTEYNPKIKMEIPQWLK